MMIAIFHPKTQTSSSQTPSSTSLGKRKALELGEAEKKIGGWVYVGSHNFSPAAWVSADSQELCVIEQIVPDSFIAGYTGHQEKSCNTQYKKL